MSEIENVLFTFGKYKNTEINICNDFTYLCKCLQHSWLNFDNRQRKAVNERVDCLIDIENKLIKWKNN